jgi:hypothetical protein
MKKVLLFCIPVMTIFFACKKDNDYAFDKSPDERLNEALASYQSKLSGAENGWKAFVTVDSGRGGTYGFYFKFNDQNRVTMVSDFDSTSAATPKESSYRLKAQQQPTLIFDTYSYLHVLADPNEDVIILANVNGGPVGKGLLSDFEYILDSTQMKDDTIRMNGKVHGSKLVLVKATKAESDVYLGGQFTLSSDFFTAKIKTYFKRLVLGSQLYDVLVNSTDRTVTINWLDNSGSPHTFKTGYYNIIGGIAFKEPFVNGSQTLSGFNNITWDGNALTVSSGGQTGTITPIVVPLYVDTQAPERWWQTAFATDSYWYSFPAFHVNGKEDGYNLESLASYYYLIYWPGYGTGNDLFAPVYINAARTGLELRYGAAPAKPAVTADGRAVFTLLGNYGTYPFAGPARDARNQLLIPEGYYFVQVSDTQYDMVSAKDGLVWISWILI